MTQGAIFIIIKGRRHALWQPAGRQDLTPAGEPANDNIDDLASIIEHIEPGADRDPAAASASKSRCADRR